MSYTGYDQNQNNRFNQQQRYQSQNNRYNQQQRYQNQTPAYPPRIVATIPNQTAGYHLQMNDENDPNTINYSKNQRDSYVD